MFDEEYVGHERRGDKQKEFSLWQIAVKNIADSATISDIVYVQHQRLPIDFIANLICDLFSQIISRREPVYVP